MQTDKQIVVIDDDSVTREILRITLASSGFKNVDFAGDGSTGLELVLAKCPDLVLLDIMLPGLDGYEVCRQIRSTDPVRDVPIIMLSAKTEVDDIVVGLDLGANAYLTKPFSRAVLLAHVRSVLRSSPKSSSKELECDGCALDPEFRCATLNGKDLALTGNEFRFLELVMAHPRRVFSRANILDAVQLEVKDVLDRSVDVMMVHLRRKLGSWSNHIQTVRGIGYRFVP